MHQIFGKLENFKVNTFPLQHYSCTTQNIYIQLFNYSENNIYKENTIRVQ